MSPSNAAIGAALSDYYPKVSISGLLGLESVNTAEFFTGQAVQHQVSAGLRWRLFDFGRVDAEVGEARGHYAESLAAWRSTVLVATGEVETALTSLRENETRIRTLTAQVAELQAERGQAETAYEGGVVSLIEVRGARGHLLPRWPFPGPGISRTASAAPSPPSPQAVGGGWNS